MNNIAAAPLLELSTAALGAAVSPTDKKSSKLAGAAHQFEALMIGEMLKSAREGSEDGWLGSGNDSSSESAMDMAESQFAQALANRGGFGLAQMVERSIANRQDAAPSESQASTAIPQRP